MQHFKDWYFSCVFFVSEVGLHMSGIVFCFAKNKITAADLIKPSLQWHKQIMQDNSLNLKEKILKKIR